MFTLSDSLDKDMPQLLTRKNYEHERQQLLLAEKDEKDKKKNGEKNQFKAAYLTITRYGKNKECRVLYVAFRKSMPGVNVNLAEKEIIAINDERV